MKITYFKIMYKFWWEHVIVPKTTTEDVKRILPSLLKAQASWSAATDLGLFFCLCQQDIIMQGMQPVMGIWQLLIPYWLHSFQGFF